MHLINWSPILVVFLASNTFSLQEKEDKRPGWTNGGLLQRIEVFQENRKLGELGPANRPGFPDQLGPPGQLQLLPKKQEGTGESSENRSKTFRRTSSQQPLPLLGAASSSRKSSETTISQGGQGIDQVPPAKVELGLEVGPGGLGANGVIIEKIERSSPAERAGLRIRDRIISVGGSPIKKIDEFHQIMGAFEPGDRTEFEFVRSGKKSKVLVGFPALSQVPLISPRQANPSITQEPVGPSTPKTSIRPFNKRKTGRSVPPVLPWIQPGTREVRAGIGVMAVAVDPVLFARDQLNVRQGAYLEEISRGSAAEKAGLTGGDVVIAIDGKKVDSAVGMAVLIQAYNPGDKAQVLYYRKNRLKRTEVQMDAVPVSESQFSSRPQEELPLGQAGSVENSKPKRASFFSDEFPRLKKVEKMIDRFSNGPGLESQPGLVEMTRSEREAALENEVRSLRERVKQQERQIHDLSEKLNLIENLLRKQE